DFGWDTVEVDGHDLAALIHALDVPRATAGGPPRMIVAHTLKGKGVSFMENVRSWHADEIAPEQYERVLLELQAPPA
ncbi:MAG: transketolase, partial [Actinobacteria bacterium]|nr:transketolase [Actinomycetota bacterium]